MSGGQRHGNTMAMSSEADPAAVGRGGRQHWISDQRVSIPTVDVVSFAFEHCETFGLDQPVSPPCKPIPPSRGGWRRASRAKPHQMPGTDAETDWAWQVFINGLSEDGQEYVSAGMARSVVKKLVNGFQAEGLVPGDCVCIHSYNHVSVLGVTYTILDLVFLRDERVADTRESVQVLKATDVGDGFRSIIPLSGSAESEPAAASRAAIPAMVATNSSITLQLLAQSS